METKNQVRSQQDVGHPTPADVRTDFLRIVVPYTTPELTRAALRHAGVCTELNVYVTLVDLQVIPFAWPLNQPPIDKKYSKHRLQELFKEARVPGRPIIVYARDRLEGFHRLLEAKSLVLLATKKRWWRTREEKLARNLSKAGHQVMLLHI